MKDIQQLIKKSNEVGRYDNVFPKTFIDAIKDRETGVSLRDILSSFNMYFLTYMGSPEDTRLQLPKSLRRMGVWITYVTWDNTVHIEWYSSDDISDETFKSSLYWKEGTNSLVGDLSISAEGNWVINGEDTNIPARGEKGISPVLRLGKNNRFQVSYNEGGSYSDITSEPIITQLRVHNNKLQKSLDLGKTWEDESDYISSYFREKDNKIQISKDKETWEDISNNIAAWFRFKTEEGQSQNNSVGKIQISRDERNTWQDLSADFTNSLHIKGYVKTKEELPEAVQGDIYGVGPIFEEEDTEKINPIYTLYVYSDGNWVNNGRYTSVAAGVVQELGDSETEVVSQKVVKKSSNLRLSFSQKNLINIDTKENTLEFLGGEETSALIFQDGTRLFIKKQNVEIPYYGVYSIFLNNEGSVKLEKQSDEVYDTDWILISSLNYSGDKYTTFLSNTPSYMIDNVPQTEFKFNIDTYGQLILTSGYLNIDTINNKIKLTEASYVWWRNKRFDISRKECDLVIENSKISILTYNQKLDTLETFPVNPNIDIDKDLIVFGIINLINNSVELISEDQYRFNDIKNNIKYTSAIIKNYPNNIENKYIDTINKSILNLNIYNKKIKFSDIYLGSLGKNVLFEGKRRNYLGIYNNKTNYFVDDWGSFYKDNIDLKGIITHTLYDNNIEVGNITINWDEVIEYDAYKSFPPFNNENSVIFNESVIKYDNIKDIKYALYTSTGSINIDSTEKTIEFLGPNYIIFDNIRTELKETKIKLESLEGVLIFSSDRYGNIKVRKQLPSFTSIMDSEVFFGYINLITKVSNLDYIGHIYYDNILSKYYKPLSKDIFETYNIERDIKDKYILNDAIVDLKVKNLEAEDKIALYGLGKNFRFTPSIYRDYLGLIIYTGYNKTIQLYPKEWGNFFTESSNLKGIKSYTLIDAVLNRDYGYIVINWDKIPDNFRILESNSHTERNNSIIKDNFKILNKYNNRKMFLDPSGLFNYFKVNTEADYSVPGKNTAKGLETADSFYKKYDELLLNHPEYIKKKILLDKQIPNYEGDKLLSMYAYEFTPEYRLLTPNSPVDYSNKKIIITTATHGSEKAGALCLYEFLKKVCEDWKSDPFLEFCRYNISFVIIPIMNPSGWERWNGYGDRKNYNGVDLNRNFPNGWRYLGKPDSPTYSGEEPLSEMESKAVVKLLEEYSKTDIDFIGFDFHNFTGNYDDLEREDYSLIWTEATSRLVLSVGLSCLRAISPKLSNKYSSIPQRDGYNVGTASLENNPSGKIADYFKTFGMASATFEVNGRFPFGENPDLYYTNETMNCGIEALGNFLRILIFNYY